MHPRKVAAISGVRVTRPTFTLATSLTAASGLFGAGRFIFFKAKHVPAPATFDRHALTSTTVRCQLLPIFFPKRTQLTAWRLPSLNDFCEFLLVPINPICWFSPDFQSFYFICSVLTSHSLVFFSKLPFPSIHWSGEPLISHHLNIGISNRSLSIL